MVFGPFASRRFYRHHLWNASLRENGFEMTCATDEEKPDILCHQNDKKLFILSVK
jgi:hypothetical protein